MPAARRIAVPFAFDALPVATAAPRRPRPCATAGVARRTGASLLLALVAAVGALAGAPRSALADEILHYREGERVDPQTVAAVLGGNATPRTRSIRLLDEPSSAPQSESATTTGGARTVADDDGTAPTGLSLPVHFAFGSAVILPDARAQLEAVVDGIRMLDPSRVVNVEGHTDAVGPDAYNLKLSRERALAVRDYLVARGIDGRRLKAVGYGETWPVQGSDPYAGINRRVQFRGG
jgi:outer membrane protein OmpA-like peptidoglycan-associated protein